MTGPFFYHKNITTKINESRSRHTHTRAHRFPSSSLSKDFGTAERCGVSHFYIEPAPINRLPCLARRSHWLTSAHSVLNSQKPQHVLGGHRTHHQHHNASVRVFSTAAKCSGGDCFVCVRIKITSFTASLSPPTPRVHTGPSSEIRATQSRTR